MPPAGGFYRINIAQQFGFAGNVQWDGRFLAIEDEEHTVIYQFAINSSFQGAEVGSTTLNGAAQVIQFWIQGGKVVAPDNHKFIWFYHYPAGGRPIKDIEGGNLLGPWGAAVSKGT